MNFRATLLAAAIILVPAAAASQPATTATDQSASQAQDNSNPAPAANAPAATAQADATCAKPGASGSSKASGDPRPDSVKSVTRDTGELGTTKAKKQGKETACADQPQ